MEFDTIDLMTIKEKKRYMNVDHIVHLEGSVAANLLPEFGLHKEIFWT